jgi:hypothetical protein
MKSVINFDSDLFKTVDLILLEKIKKIFVAAGSWQNFKMKIVAKKDLTE